MVHVSSVLFILMGFGSMMMMMVHGHDDPSSPTESPLPPMVSPFVRRAPPTASPTKNAFDRRAPTSAKPTNSASPSPSPTDAGAGAGDAGSKPTTSTSPNAQANVGMDASNNINPWI